MPAVTAGLDTCPVLPNKPPDTLPVMPPLRPDKSIASRRANCSGGILAIAAALSASRFAAAAVSSSEVIPILAGENKSGVYPSGDR